MPKSKEMVSSDESGSSTEDETPKKKSKVEKPKKEAKKPAAAAAKKSGEDYVWELGNLKQVSVREFKGKVLIDFREMYLDKETGDMKPGRKGVCLSPANFDKLLDIIDEVKTTVKEKF